MYSFVWSFVEKSKPSFAIEDEGFLSFEAGYFIGESVVENACGLRPICVESKCADHM